MRKKFIRRTSGWIPVSVLVLFTIALVVGQARANLPNEIKAVPSVSATTSMTIVLSKDMLQKLESLPRVVDAFLDMPSDFDIDLDASVSAPGDGDGHDASPNPQ